MKKGIAILLAVTMIFGLTACGGSSESAPVEDAAEEAVAEAPDIDVEGILSDALAQTLPEAGVAITYVSEDEDPPTMVNVKFNFDKDQLFTRFTYYLAKFGQNEFPTEAAQTIDSLNETKGEDYFFCTLPAGGALTLSYENSEYDCIVSFTSNWFEDGDKQFVDKVVGPAVFAAVGEVESDAVEDMNAPLEAGSSVIFPDGLFMLYSDSMDDTYMFLISPCTPENLEQNGMTDAAQNYIVKYMYENREITAGAYYSESEKAAMEAGSLGAENASGVFIDGGNMMLQIPTAEGNVIASGIYRYNTEKEVYETSNLTMDNLTAVFTSGLQFTFENDTIKFQNVDESFVGGFELPAAFGESFVLVMGI